MNTFQIITFLSFGVNYAVSEKYQAFGHSTLRYHITTLVEDTPINERLYDYGLEIGVRRKIK